MQASLGKSLSCCSYLSLAIWGDWSLSAVEPRNCSKTYRAKSKEYLRHSHDAASAKSGIRDRSLTRTTHWQKNVNVSGLQYTIAIFAHVLPKLEPVGFESTLQVGFYSTNSNTRINTLACRTLERSKQILRLPIGKLRRYLCIYFLLIEQCSEDTNSKSTSVSYNIKPSRRTIDLLENKDDSAGAAHCDGFLWLPCTGKIFCPLSCKDSTV